MTKRFAVIGHPIEHSRSPQLHEAGFSEFNIDATFEKIDVAPEELKDFIEHEAQHFMGIAVTVPHKEMVFPYVDNVTEAAEHIGAVNTLFWKDGKLHGTNTDGIGALRALETLTTMEEKNVLVLGAGGAARSIIYALKKAQAKVFVYNRTYSKVEALFNEFDIIPLNSLQTCSPEEFDVIINSTSVGLKSFKSILPEDFWRPTHIGFDIVYDPLYTKFLEDCENAGGQVITGDKMLVHQAAAQFKLWHEKDIEPEILEAAFFSE